MEYLKAEMLKNRRPNTAPNLKRARLHSPLNTSKKYKLPPEPTFLTRLLNMSQNLVQNWKSPAPVYKTNSFKIPSFHSLRTSSEIKISHFPKKERQRSAKKLRSKMSRRFSYHQDLNDSIRGNNETRQMQKKKEKSKKLHSNLSRRNFYYPDLVPGIIEARESIRQMQKKKEKSTKHSHPRKINQYQINKSLFYDELGTRIPKKSLQYYLQSTQTSKGHPKYTESVLNNSLPTSSRLSRLYNYLQDNLVRSRSKSRHKPRENVEVFKGHDEKKLFSDLLHSSLDRSLSTPTAKGTFNSFRKYLQNDLTDLLSASLKRLVGIDDKNKEYEDERGAYYSSIKHPLIEPTSRLPQHYVSDALTRGRKQRSKYEQYFDGNKVKFLNLRSKSRSKQRRNIVTLSDAETPKFHFDLESKKATKPLQHFPEHVVFTKRRDRIKDDRKVKSGTDLAYPKASFVPQKPRVFTILKKQGKSKLKLSKKQVRFELPEVGNSSEGAALEQIDQIKSMLRRRKIKRKRRSSNVDAE